LTASSRPPSFCEPFVGAGLSFVATTPLLPSSGHVAARLGLRQ
jgi:hypothetical protein